jgi:stearoyl-CoA desaturase (delta-9 desaturase)
MVPPPLQGDPIEWISAHRYHHLHTDTPLDPHSPYEGFWFSHLGWLFDQKYREFRTSDKSNSREMERQPFYRFLRRTYALHILAQFLVLFYFAGFPGIVWGGALRICWVLHNTWNVNSVAHVWGYQTYKTGDLSRNNWLVALLTFGEGWHNNHHAFKFSARHGLQWWQFDATYIVIKALEVSCNSPRPPPRIYVYLSRINGTGVIYSV